MYRYAAPIVLATLLLSSIAAAEWSDDIRLTIDPSQSHLPSIAADSKNDLHVVWIDGRGPGVYYKKIDSSGKTLVQDKKLIDLNHFTGESSAELFTYDRPHLCVDSMDNINIVFDNYNRGCNPSLPPIERTKDITYVKLDLDGKSIISSKIIKTGAGVRSTDIGSDSEGEIYIVWEGYSDIHNSTSSKDYYTKLNQEGDVLKDSDELAANVQQASNLQEFPRVAIDHLDNVHIIWGNGAAVGSIVLDKNDSRIKDQTLGISGLYSDIIADSKDVHAIIADGLTGSTQGLEYIKFDSSGNILENGSQVLAAANGGEMHPQIDVGPTDNVHVAWFQSDLCIYYMLLNNKGAKLIPETKITFNESKASYPDLAVDSHNCVHIVWEDSRDGNSEIYYKYSCPVIPEPAPAQSALDSGNNRTAPMAANETKPSASNETAHLANNVTALPVSKEAAPSTSTSNDTTMEASIAAPLEASNVAAPSAGNITAAPAINEAVQPAINEPAPSAGITAAPEVSKEVNQEQLAGTLHDSQTATQKADGGDKKNIANGGAAFAVPSSMNKGSPSVTRVALPVANKLRAWIDTHNDVDKAAEDKGTRDQVADTARPASLANDTIEPDKSSSSIQMGKSNTNAIGVIGKPSSVFGRQAVAANNIEIKKNQDAGGCTPCQNNCRDACTKVDLDMIKIRDRSSSAWGSSDATSSVRIITNQE